MPRLANALRRHARRELYMLVKPSAGNSRPKVCVCVCAAFAFGKVIWVIEVGVGACDGLWSGEDVFEAVEDLFLA